MALKLLAFVLLACSLAAYSEAKVDGGDKHSGGGGGGKVHGHHHKHGVPAEAPIAMSPESKIGAPKPSAEAPHSKHPAHPPHGKHEVGSPAPQPAHHRKHGHFKSRALFESLDVFGWGRSLKAGHKHKKHHHKGAVAPAPAPGHLTHVHAPAPAPYQRRHHHKRKGSH